jgi:hypothetical protein
MEASVIAERALGFDLDAELDFCQVLSLYGSRSEMRDEFDAERAHRLLQAVLSTGRHRTLGAYWRESVAAGVQTGSLAPPEWN